MVYFRLVPDGGLALPVPLVPWLVVLSGRGFGGFNLYGSVYRDTYSYSSKRPNLVVDYGIVIGDSGAVVRYSEPLVVISLNLVLERLGYLAFGSGIGGIDWGRTIAWCDGSDWAMVNLNVRGRQLHGVVCQRDYYTVLGEVESALGEEIGRLGYSAVMVRPYEHYSCVGVPPDLLVSVPGVWFSGSISGDIVEPYTSRELVLGI